MRRLFPCGRRSAQGLHGTSRRWGTSRIDGVKWAGENLTEIARVWLPDIMSLPDSLPWMESVDAKMVRAKEHLDTLHAEAGVFFESTKRNFILKSNEQEAWIVHYMEGSIPPIRLGVLLGECVFNIRSALDNLVCGLIRTADSHAPCKGIQFPICSAEEQWEIQPSARVEARGTDILIIREIGPWGQRPVWSVLTDLCEYVRDHVVIPLKPFFVASHFSSP